MTELYVAKKKNSIPGTTSYCFVLFFGQKHSIGKRSKYLQKEKKKEDRKKQKSWQESGGQVYFLSGFEALRAKEKKKIVYDDA